MPAEPLIEWPESLVQLLEFVGAFLALGATGFRYAVLGRLAPSASDASTEAVYGEAVYGEAVYADASRRAAGIGLVGAALGLLQMAIELPDLAARRHLGLAAAIAGDPLTSAWVVLMPRLGSDVAGDALRRSARLELAIAALVLIVTSILVSLPAPGE